MNEGNRVLRTPANFPDRSKGPEVTGVLDPRLERELLFRGVPGFSQLPYQEFKGLTSLAVPNFLRNGELAYLAGEKVCTLFLIARGKIKLSLTSRDGREMTLAILGTGDEFGNLRLTEDVAQIESASALGNVQLYKLCVVPIREFCRGQEGFYREFMRVVDERRLLIEQTLLDYVGRDIRSRLAGWILGGVSSANSDSIRVPFSREELAALLGCSREWVSVVLSSLQREGILQVKRREIKILRRNALERMVFRGKYERPVGSEPKGKLVLTLPNEQKRSALT